MKFEVPFNNDPEIIDYYVERKEHIHFVYWKADDWFSSGRKMENKEIISLDELIKLIQKLKGEWISFNYVLNWKTSNNEEFDLDFRKKYVDFVRFLKNSWVDVVSISNPVLIELIKNEIPDIKIFASVILDVKNLVELKQVIDLWVDYVCLSKSLLKNFNALWKMAKYAKSRNVELFLIANDPCLSQCVMSSYHYDTISSKSIWARSERSYPKMRCTEIFSSSDSSIISSTFIRPEDLEIYEYIWFNNFKLTDREHTTEWNIKAFDSYINRRYEWKLADIMWNWSNRWKKYKKPIKLNSRKFNLDAIKDLKDNMRFVPYIDNRKLDNYLDFWLKYRKDGCANELCEECLYCEKIWKRAIKRNVEERSIVSSNIQKCINKICSIDS